MGMSFRHSRHRRSQLRAKAYGLAHLVDLQLDDVSLVFLPSRHLNIEDATTTWPQETESYVKVARIIIEAPQTPHTSEEEATCENLAFTPWHALAAHRPIGGINRLRRKVYAASADHRGADGY